MQGQICIPLSAAVGDRLRKRYKMFGRFLVIPLAAPSPNAGCHLSVGVYFYSVGRTR